MQKLFERSWQRGLLHLEYLNQERFRSVLAVVRILLRFVRATVALLIRVQSNVLLNHQCSGEAIDSTSTIRLLPFRLAQIN